MSRLLKGKDNFDNSLPIDLQRIEQLLLHEEQQLTTLQQENDNRVSRLNTFGIQSVSEEQNKLLKQQAQMQRAFQASQLLAQLCIKREEASTELAALMRQLAVKQEQSSPYRNFMIMPVWRSVKMWWLYVVIYMTGKHVRYVVVNRILIDRIMK